ncbi:MAG: R3H domain-containing nucleic acid-binding protein [Actinomycetota bacterium]
MEWVETTGKSVHDAKEAALDVLGVHEDDAEFDVVAEEKIGLFGRVKEEARVRARVQPTTPRAKDDRRRRRRGGGKGRSGKGDGHQPDGKKNTGQNQNAGQKGKNGGESREKQPQQAKKAAKKAAKKQASNRNGNERKQDAVSDEPTMPLSEQADIAESFVAGLAEHFGTSVSFAREDIAEDEIRLTANGSGIGRMIGQRGATAGAIDELVRTVLQRHAGSGRDGRVRVDMGGVRARRAEALAAFTREQAEAVRSSGVARVLEPMGGSDRKVVHDTISGEDGVETTSQGEDPNRRVVIVPANADD